VDLIALTCDLLALDSTTGREGETGRFLADFLQNRGHNVALQEVTAGRWNVYAHRAPPWVVLSTHIDTVPPYVPPVRKGGRIYGRGACDAKGIVAAMVAAAEALADRGEERIGLLFLVGEEKGSDGAQAAGALEPKGRVLIAGEPTQGRLVAASRGILRVRVRTYGRAAHSAVPGAGASAIEELLDLLVELRRLPLPVNGDLGVTSYSIGTVTGGAAANVVPDEAQAEILFRTVEAGTNLRHALSEWTRGRGELEFTLEIPPGRFLVEPDLPTTTVPFATDLPFLVDWGRQYLVGPGSIELAHTPEESIAEGELIEGARLYEQLAARVLRREDASAHAG
jgi:acetylornithine deacetylase